MAAAARATGQSRTRRLVTLLTTELGTDSIERAKTYLEEPLRMTVHLIMSMPEYQLV